MKCVELFAGAGGAAIGLERAGFDAVLRVERDHDACATLRASALRVSNVTRPLLLPTLWGLVMSGVADVRDGAVFRDLGSVDLLWASPPCQAWSMAGSRDGAYDEDRNGFPWTWAAIDAVRPTWATPSALEAPAGVPSYRTILSAGAPKRTAM